MNHPIQPIAKDDHDCYRFKANEIVRYLLDNGPFDMNHLSMQDFSQEDREQFAQLIGYSLSGYGDLSYVRDETYKTAFKMASGEGQDERDARIQVLEEKLSVIRDAVKEMISHLFLIHPTDLHI